jgi:hypothetical protein
VAFYDLGKIAEKEWPQNFRLKPQGNFEERCASLDVDKSCNIAAQRNMHEFFGKEERCGSSRLAAYCEGRFKLRR